MNYADWYTDRMDIHRVKPVKDGALTRHERVRTAKDVPCRIYRSGVHGPRMQSTACANAVDVRPGDELLVYRGKGLGQVQQTIRAFAGEPVHYYEPFGAVIPGLAHQEIALLQKEYLDAEAEEGADDGAG